MLTISRLRTTVQLSSICFLKDLKIQQEQRETVVWNFQVYLMWEKK